MKERYSRVWAIPLLVFCWTLATAACAWAQVGNGTLTGGGAEPIAQAARAYGARAAAMARLELEALSTVIGIADPDLQHREGIQAAFVLVRGMFLRSKWDEIPNGNLPSY